VHAVVQMAGIAPDVRHRLRLVMVGDGALRREVARVLEGAGLSGQAWLPGTMGGIEDILHGLDIFVLPSLSEGVSNTVLEAMASGLPIVATGTGGNPELLDDGITGTLVPPADSAALSAAILRYARQPALRREHGHKARQAALERFSLSVAVARYREIYRDLLERRCPHVLSRYGNQLNA
jgi:glycosyltransferase involved in cell wall biosynthesis